MSEVKVYYVVFTDKETGLVGAQNCVDYETAVNVAEIKQQNARYSGILITEAIAAPPAHSSL